MKPLYLLASALLALLPGLTRAQTLANGSFEAPQPGSRQLPASWTIVPAPGYAIALDSAVAQGGRRSLHLASTTEAPEGFQAFRQSVAVQVAQPTLLHLRATVKTSEAKNVALLCQYWDDTKMVGLTNSLMQGAPPTGPGEWRTLDLTLLVQPTMRRVVVGGFYVGRGQAWFDELQLSSAGFPEGPPSAAVQTYLDAVLDKLRTRSLVRDSIDWGAARREALAIAHGMQTPADSHPVVGFLLAKLRRYGDTHTFFEGPAAVSASLAPATAANAATIAAPSARYLGDGLAYVAVPGFGSSNAERQLAFASQLQALIRQLDTENRIGGWVVDLRANGGGNMYPMLAGLGPLVGTGTLGYFVAGKQEERVAYKKGEAYLVRPRYKGRVPQPYRLRRPGKASVAVLIGPRTGSSGEITALAFWGRPATRLFGQPSAGYTTVNQSFMLPDGARLNLAVGYDADRTHRQYRGPIVPDEAVPAAPADGSTDPALAAAQTWLRQRAPAGQP